MPKKTDNLKPFKKGADRRRNTKGRPKGSRNRSTLVREWLEAVQTAKNPITGKDETVSQADILVWAMMKQARKGNVQAYRELMDSAYGEIKNISMTQEEDGAVSVTFRTRKNGEEDDG